MKRAKNSPVLNKMDILEGKKNVLEAKLRYLQLHGAKKSSIANAHAKFFRAYMSFARIVTKAAEQGIL